MLKSKQAADDLFEKSSMSFGEHLEELRKALGKSLIWLGLGTAVGLFFAENIVSFIETPLRQAITQFYIDQAKQQYRDANGEDPSEELALWMTTTEMMPERVFFDPAVLDEGPPAPPIAASGSTDKDAPETDGSGESTNPAESDKPVKSKKPADSKKLAESSTSAGSADATDSNTSPDSPAALVASEASPWEGINIEKLQRLEPLLLWRPIPNKLVSLTATEPFMMWLKAGLVAGCVLGSPGIFWHIWQFFAAGLYPHERRYVYWYLPLSLLLFFAGVCLAFFVVFRLVLGFLMTYTTGLNVEFTPRLNDYMSFALFLPLGFGITFQLPIVMLGLHRFGVVSVQTFLSQWKIAVLSIAFLSMLFTPAEIYSMIGLFLPLTGLYFFGIFLCKYMPQGPGVGAPALDPQG